MINNNHGFLSQFCKLQKQFAKFRGGYSCGFTLLELLVAVIIVGILISLAIPIQTKNVEKSKTGEVVATLNLIRLAEKDYFLDNGTFTSSIGNLNIGDPNDITNRYFDYTIPSADANNFIARATRRDGPYAGDYYTIDKNGAIDSSNGHFQL